MNFALWSAQVAVALIHLAAGGLKVSQPIDALAKRLRVAVVMPPPAVRGIGAVEILGAAGLILPAASGILPWLTPLAAAGLALLQVGALAFNLREREYPHIALNVAIIAAAVFVTYGRMAGN